MQFVRAFVSQLCNYYRMLLCRYLTAFVFFVSLLVKSSFLCKSMTRLIKGLIQLLYSGEIDLRSAITAVLNLIKNRFASI